MQWGPISKELKAINEHKATVCHGPWNTNGQTCSWKQTLMPKCVHHKESKSKFESQSLVCFYLGLSTSCSLLAESKEVLKEETSAKQPIYSSWQGSHPISLSISFWRENELDSLEENQHIFSFLFSCANSQTNIQVQFPSFNHFPTSVYINYFKKDLF